MLPFPRSLHGAGPDSALRGRESTCWTRHPTASQGVTPKHHMVRRWGKGIALPESLRRAGPDSRIAGSPPQHHMVSGWGKGATLPWVTVWGRARLPTASQGVTPKHQMVRGWSKGVALPESRCSDRPDSRIQVAVRAALCGPSSDSSREGQA